MNKLFGLAFCLFGKHKWRHFAASKVCVREGCTCLHEVNQLGGVQPYFEWPRK